MRNLMKRPEETQTEASRENGGTRIPMTEKRTFQYGSYSCHRIVYSK